MSNFSIWKIRQMEIHFPFKTTIFHFVKFIKQFFAVQKAICYGRSAGVFHGKCREEIYE
jgi:hypothetical protein